MKENNSNSYKVKRNCPFLIFSYEIKKETKICALVRFNVPSAPSIYIFIDIFNITHRSFTFSTTVCNSEKISSFMIYTLQTKVKILREITN